MYRKDITYNEYVINLKDMSEQVFTELYSDRIKYLEKENPKHLLRTRSHYAAWWENFRLLKEFNVDTQIPHYCGIFKIFTEAKNAEVEAECRAFLSEMRVVFEKHETFMTLAMVFHDVGKLVQDPNHHIISYEKFLELSKNNFEKLKNTQIYEYLAALDEEDRYIMGLLIKYHAVGGLSYDGNLGIVYQLQKEYEPVKKLLWNEFLDILICFVALDKACVANAANKKDVEERCDAAYVEQMFRASDGFLNWYDIARVQHVLKSDLKINDLDAWADIVTNNFVMNHADKQAANDFYYPKFRQIAANYLSMWSEPFLQQINQSLAQALDFGYINNYLLYFAWDDKYAAYNDEDRFKPEDFCDDMDMLTKYFMAKTAVVFFYAQEKADIEKPTFLGSVKNENEKNIFALQTTEELLVAMADYVATGRSTRILRLPGVNPE